MIAEPLIDIRAQDHSQQQECIFSALDGLESNDVLRILLDSNPMSLVERFRISNKFDSWLEVHGSKQWILEIKRKGVVATVP